MGDAVAAEIVATDYHTAGEPFRIVTAGAPPIAGATVARAPRARGRRPRRSTACGGCCATSRAATPTCTAASSCRPTTTAPTSACCSGTRTASRPPAGTARSRSARGRWSRAASRRRADGDGRRDDRRAVRAGSPRACAARGGRGRARSPSATCPSFVDRARRRRRPGVDGRRGLRRRDLRARARAADFGLRGRARAPAASSSPPAARSSARSRAPTPRATPTTSGCRASTAPSSTRTLGAAAPAQRDDLRRRRGRPLAVRLGDLGAAARCSPPTASSARATSCATTRSSARRSSPRVVGERRATACSPRSQGMAYRTGEHRFVLDPRDPLGTGFVLR